jgi:DNA-binding transcriptional LysR family regulator
MELRHLRYFVAVAEEGSLTVAAQKRLHTAQPSLSRQIHDLELELGVQLLIRGPRGVELTASGRVFLDHARVALLQVEAATEAARRAAQPARTSFAIGFLTGYEMDWLPAVMGILRAELPSTEVVIHSQDSPDLAAGLIRGKIDLAFLRPEKHAPAAVQKPSDQPYQPIWPALELANESVLPPRPEARPPSAPADPAFVALGARMMPDLVATQNVTLSGFRLLDRNGVVIAGREEVGLSLAHLEEVSEALQGRFSGVLRVRISKHDQPSLYSMSRGTGMRVFTAMPVIVGDQVTGVVYASRTPSNVFKYLYEHRKKLIVAMLSMIVPTLLIGFLFHRTITEPMRELVERTDLVGKGDRDALAPAQAPWHQRVRPPVAKFSGNGATPEYALQLYLDLCHPCVA